eukprot:TRINITY_DN7727_c0_g1_i3.p1 TRINITY_DN7727_c0_g1~~TRINITY_DN7727_c0_g1_i3.p1  ORF type:complete len:170 (-),score=28.15 TRINITY_DN7727_c0_g1_i3:56-565(-)
MTGTIDYFISIERLGRAKDSRYYNMRGEDVSQFVRPIDQLFIEAYENDSNITTLGIGDGGNEIGMGNIHDVVISNINKGETIACIVKCHHLITAGVSNWGAYGLVAAMALLDSSKSLQLSVEEEVKFMQDAVDLGAVDGLTGVCEKKVDGFSFDYHKNVLEDILKIVKS